MFQELGTRRSLARIAATLSVVAMLALLTASPALALPQFTRQLGVPCSMCHYPTPPRLNVYGEKFRRA